MFDVNGEGFLSYEDLREAMYSVKGLDMNEQELQEIIRKMDTDGNK